MKLSNRILSVFLTVLLLAVTTLPAFATDSSEEFTTEFSTESTTAVTADTTKESTTSPYAHPLGDVDLSGNITAADARIVLRVAAQLITIDSYRMLLADYDQDTKVNSSDARYILRHSAQLDPFAPETTTVTTTKAPVTTTKAPETTTKLTDANRKYKYEKSDKFKTSYAKYAVLYDYDNDKILYGKNMHSKLHPASTTKVITAVLGCEYLSENYVLTVGNELNLLESNTSRAGIYKGQKIKFKEILKCLFAPSGCDAAYTIAVHVARVASGDKNMSAQKALNYFVNMMNTYTKKLGMNDSHFANPDGYPNSNHYTSAYDMTIMTTKAYSFKLIRDIVSEPWVTAYFESGGSAKYTNSNELINPYSDRYLSYIVGMKTGSHSQAGQCLVTVGKKKIAKTGKTKTFIAVVYNCPSKYGRYMDLKSLYDTAFSYFWQQP